MMHPDQRDRRRHAFARGVGALITAIGAIAILGPEAAHTMVAQTIGLLLVVTGALGLISLLSRRRGHPKRGVWIWSLVALGVGVALMITPVHGVAAAGSLVGLLLVGHGFAAAALALRRWPSRDAVMVAGSLAGSLMALLGLALLFGKQPGDQADEILIGIDMAMFGAYLIVGHELIETSSDTSPSTSSR